MTTDTKSVPRLVGAWPFSEGSGRVIADESGNGNNLVADSDPVWVAGPTAGSQGVKGDGAGFDMVTAKPAVVTDESFSIAAWVRLDSDLCPPDGILPPGWFALTAIAQSGSYHSPFYLGVRNIEYGGEGTGDFHLHWNFTVAPIDGSDDGPVDWVHAYSSIELTRSELDDWVLIVGVYDLEAGVARIHVPNRNDKGETPLPDNWPKWNGDHGLHVGQAWFRDEFVDQWPGSIGGVWAYQGAISQDEVDHLAHRLATG
ncbi:LamG-like jellyroll fold domain-containing protein [Amycolatopsis sp. NPDC051102]|uniref:LamG-like jellyroll fold domain-containing protein n=1 Tax=Amycolatopsis sp. NPDC051102 TaxID=3155163 RepID=UPI003421CB87